MKKQSRESMIHNTDIEPLNIKDQATNTVSLQISFSPGDDRLKELELKRVLGVGKILSENTELTVALHGHADSRGTDEYNNVLSIERAKAIKCLLLKMGIREDRVTTKGHGALFTTAKKGNVNMRQQDRRVAIEIFSSYSKKQL